MSNIPVTHHDAKEHHVWDVPTGNTHVFQLQKPTVYVLELEDIHFHHDSAVLLPDERPAAGSPSTPADAGDTAAPTSEAQWAALAAIATALRYAKRERERKLLVVGHADTSGDAAYNLPLSRNRAKAVQAVLCGNREDWVDVCTKKSKVEDYQQILKWVAAAWRWPCDPGKVDNVHGPDTTKAVRAFQDHYSHHWDDDSKKVPAISVDGAVGKETWGAIFDVYQDAIEQILEVDTEPEMNEYRAALRWLHDGTPRVGCGENWPIDSPELPNYRSTTNRRVELLFFPPDDEPAVPLKCHPSEERCDAASCQIYWKYRRIYLPVDPFTGADAANYVRFTALDRWFVPGVESCDIGYALTGPRTSADKLLLEVRASNYCELQHWNDGLPRWRVVDNPVVYASELQGELVAEGAQPTITDWKGRTNCLHGIVGKGADGHDRVVNVACSPYTVHLRYFRDEAEKTARIDLPPWWPEFDATGAPVPASLEVKWAVRGTTRLTNGHLVVWDREGAIVFTRDLTGPDLTEGEHSFAWDGVKTDGSRIEAGAMPYRVQVRGHARRGEENGLALAAAHTEVRLFVHPETLPLDADPYNLFRDRTSLRLGVADVFHRDAEPTRAADGALWTKFALAKSGFHPGPVNDAAMNDHFRVALGEFQRSVPKHSAGPPYDRLTVSQSDDADTKDALARLPANRRRAWFGLAADRTDLGTDGEDLGRRFGDPMSMLVVWVDDRNWYTDPSWLQPPRDDVEPLVADRVRAHRTALGNTRGPYTWRDARVTRDEVDVARPWIPVQTEFRLLSKAEHLDTVPEGAPSDEVAAATREAIGPLRVDWSFQEIDSDPISVLDVDRARYHRERTRTRAALEWALEQLKTANYVRKDVKLRVSYHNCPVENGGIRPRNGANYWKAPFGLGAECLLPWRTAEVTDRETVLTVVHDRMGQPAAAICGVRRVGRAGVWFHPSRMAGDGYRLRAQVWFGPHAEYSFPNTATLAKRYPRPPQAHTADLRLWRKTTIRGYMRWGAPHASWPTTRAGMLEQLAGCNLHLANELGLRDAEVMLPLSSVWSNAQVATFRSTVKSCVADEDDPRRQDANIDLTADHIWPWHAHPNLGQVTPIGPNTPNADVWKAVGAAANAMWGKLTNQYAIEIADTLERKFGRMRGHIIVEFRATPSHGARQYRCDDCGDRWWYCTQDGNQVTHAGADCPSDCGGTLRDTGQKRSWVGQLPVPSLGDPIGVSYDFDSTPRLWTHELSHNRYYEHCANAPGAYDPHHDHVDNPDPVVSADAFTRPAAPDGDGTHAARQWDRCCTMTYVTHLAGYDATKDAAYFCFRCVLKNRGWKLAGVPSPPATVCEP